MTAYLKSLFDYKIVNIVKPHETEDEADYILED